MNRLFLLRPLEAATIEQDVKIVEQRTREVPVRDGDEVFVLVVGTARVLDHGAEVEIQQPRIVRVVEIRRTVSQ